VGPSEKGAMEVMEDAGRFTALTGLDTRSFQSARRQEWSAEVHAKKVSSEIKKKDPLRGRYKLIASRSAQLRRVKQVVQKGRIGSALLFNGTKRNLDEPRRRGDPRIICYNGGNVINPGGTVQAFSRYQGKPAR